MFDVFIELAKVRNEPHCCILFEMMKVGAAHSLSLICFNILKCLCLVKIIAPEKVIYWVQ